MNKRLLLPALCFFLFVSLLAAPALAATVTCHSDCSCLLPADAKKAGLSAYCSGKQQICGYDGNFEKYCYTKAAAAVTTTTAAMQLKATVTKTVTATTTTPAVPQLIMTGVHPIPTTEQILVKCASGCECLLPDQAKAEGFASRCGSDNQICDLVKPSATSTSTDIKMRYCYKKTPPTPAVIVSPYNPVFATTTTVTTTLTTTAPKPGPSAESPVPTSMLIPAVISTTQTPVSAAVRTVSKRDIAIAKLFGIRPPQSSTPQQRVLCNGSFVNVLTDPANCGSCGAFCAEGLVCSMGQCSYSIDSTVQSPCSPFQIQCNGTCSSYLHDNENCGRCGNGCGVFETCCGGRCTNTNSDSENCHDCGNRCGENAVCSFGLCTCTNSTIRCGTVCADPLTNEEHCGGCNTRCGAGEECCAGHCIDVTRNANNCGTCNHSCGVGIYCIDGRCVNPDTNEEHCGDANTPCGPGQFCCNGVCINPRTNPGHCGSCNTQCYGLPCTDGECINFENDEDNCGSLGNYCWGGNGGHTCCNGRCANLESDDNNCGHCGHACWGVTPYCMYGECVGVGTIVISAIFGIY